MESVKQRLCILKCLKIAQSPELPPEAAGASLLTPAAACHARMRLESVPVHPQDPCSPDQREGCGGRWQDAWL